MSQQEQNDDEVKRQNEIYMQKLNQEVQAAVEAAFRRGYHQCWAAVTTLVQEMQRSGFAMEEIVLVLSRAEDRLIAPWRGDPNGGAPPDIDARALLEHRPSKRRDNDDDNLQLV